MELIRNYAHELLKSLENKPNNAIELEDKLEDSGFEFEIDVIKNLMYFVQGKDNAHELLDTILIEGV